MEITRKKIALCAPFSGINFGTILQAYCLAKFIVNRGISCEYLVFSPEYKRSIPERALRKMKSFFNKNNPISNRYTGIDDYSFVTSEQFSIQKAIADAFVEKNIPYCHTIFSPRNMPRGNQYSKFIVGSDQVWSLERYDKYAFYFLPFVKKRTKKYSYASSLGTTNLTKQHLEILLKHLPNFEKISCRERSNCSALSEKMKKKVEAVVDPTMLFDKSFWDNFSKEIDLPDEYVLAYILGEKDKISLFAERLGAIYDIPVYYVVTRPYYSTKKNIIFNISPEEWVFSIIHAKFVVTDSFHGTLFCINLNKDFYSFTKRDNDSSIMNDNDRISELVGDFCLYDRLLDDNFDVNSFVPAKINYDSINIMIEQKRLGSINYLVSIIK